MNGMIVGLKVNFSWLGKLRELQVEFMNNQKDMRKRFDQVRKVNGQKAPAFKGCFVPAPLLKVKRAGVGPNSIGLILTTRKAKLHVLAHELHHAICFAVSQHTGPFQTMRYGTSEAEAAAYLYGFVLEAVLTKMVELKHEEVTVGDKTKKRKGH